eukprot:TRINITY_DN76433_c0_g1_i1.p2 TRINITY_DN76433_c0_g1~~TRINITY_DN76433_c0_g1_i1.p2  ORF type:complete len:210 (-),score=30.55 TRINITY_DN76433_c0_g1_i1:85-714(-)
MEEALPMKALGRSCWRSSLSLVVLLAALIVADHACPAAATSLRASQERRVNSTHGRQMPPLATSPNVAAAIRSATYSLREPVAPLTGEVPLPTVGLQEARSQVAALREEVTILRGRSEKLLSDWRSAAGTVNAIKSEAQQEVQATVKDLRMAMYLCGSLKSCEQCRKASGACGWCSVESKCVPGDKLGIFASPGGSCPVYRWDTCQEPE